MREILSKHTLRQLKLLEFLDKSTQGWILLKDISDYLKVPIRTIHSDIREINTYINPIYIKSSPSGVRLTMPPNYSERFLYKKILEKSRRFKIIESVFMNEEETVESLSEKLYISVSSLKRMIKEINQVLIKEGFSIRGRPLSILGDEQKLIQFMSYYFNERYFFEEEFMTSHQKDLIIQLINNVLKETGKEIYFPNLKRISTRVYLSCIRLKNHHRIPTSQDIWFQNNILEDKDFCDDFFKAFRITLTNEIIKQLFYIYSRENYIFNTKELNNLIHKNSYQKSLCQEITKVLENISIQLHIPQSQNVEKLLIDIFNIINIKNINCSNTFTLYDRREHFLSQLSVNYMYIGEIIKNHLKENISLDFSEIEWNELNYILLTHWAELYEKIRFIEIPVKVFLFIDTDIEHGSLIKKELETYSRYNIEVENIKNYSNELLLGLSTDSILITNIPGLADVSCHTLCFGEFLSNKDWQEFNKMIENILIERRMSEKKGL